jgi:hypothetical protein
MLGTWRLWIEQLQQHLPHLFLQQFQFPPYADARRKSIEISKCT